MRASVLGASGYVGAELLRLAANHDHLEIVAATGEAHAGSKVATHVPALAALYPDTRYVSIDELDDVDMDVAFVALPHGKSQDVVPGLLERGVDVVDLGADFRLRRAADYVEWYHDEHRAPALLDSAVYGLVERHREELAGATLIAVPGCFPTATSLAFGPFIDAGVLSEATLIVTALTGVSGAGRATSDRLHFSRLAGNAEAYGLLSHRHTAEMHQELGRPVLFTPHLVPVSRGMLVSGFAPVDSLTSEDALALLRASYRDEPFVVVVDEPPTLKDPLGSNLCFVSARVDPRTKTLVVMSSLDNLVKGAAGQAVQAWNVARGYLESTGLSRGGLTP
ncbi:MAG TPA: N-acetyl-gamma-glutamyl-phosphate reductase [Acidimicrobiales bacterium]|nr:MAG: N-acetyl-gamma-glutamyl-phosphate reductase [Actinobacteria bacterium 21-64-8]HQT98959.1 N-acetyl-gamma-glutamyl-phosphate reductase [Acidimicrobiales bacterium]